MAFIVKSEGNSGRALDYPELAQLYRSALKGNAAAAIAFQRLPAGERRLAEMLVKNFGKAEITKSAKPKKPKSPKKPPQAPLKATLTAELNSSDPSVREAAKKALEAL